MGRVLSTLDCTSPSAIFQGAFPPFSPQPAFFARISGDNRRDPACASSLLHGSYVRRSRNRPPRPICSLFEMDS